MSKLIYLLLLLLYLVKSSECDKNKSDDRSLYENSTAILSVSPSNVKTLVYDKPYAVLLFLYQNWCDECIKQIDTNLQLEKELAYWQPTLKFATVAYDSQAGRDFNVTGSFEYRLVKPHTLSLKHVIAIDLGGVPSAENIIRTTISALLKLNKTNQELKELNWPKLNPLEPADLQQADLFNDRTLLFVNKDNSLEARHTSVAVTLDFANYTDQLDILNCNESVFATSKHTKKHIELPALYQFVAQDKTLSLLGQGLSREEFRNLTAEKYLADKWTPILVDTKPKIKNLTEDRQEKKIANVFPVYFRDLNNALRKVIFSDLTKFKVLTPEQVEVVTNLTAVFREYYPYDNENTRRFLKRVSLWMKERNQTDPLKVEKFKATIKAGAEGFLQTEQPFISCKGSQPHLRGYPCSIWLLFHSLTVQEYIKLTNKTAAAAKKTNTTLPDHSVLRSMQGYMKHFFPCTDCAKSFAEDSADLESKLVNANSSILWLWQEHNRMNVRLANKTNDDPESPKQVFPNYESCKACYLAEPASVQKPEDLDALQWNQTEVVSFLVNQYRKESILKSAAVILTSSGYLLLLVAYALARFSNGYLSV